MDVFSSVIYGFHVALQPMNLVYCFIGVLIGTLVGVLPGIGPAGSIALLLPSTFRLSPVSAIIMLAGIWYGVMYGGSRTSILVNIPGEPTSVVTCLDGYPMTLKGRAGPALGMAAFASFIAGTFSIIGLTFMGPALASVALKFGPPEFFSLMIVGIMILSYLSSGSMIKALMMAAVGMILGGVGMDIISGKYRFTFDIQALLDGIGLVPAVMGLFGISEVLANLETKIEGTIVKAEIKNIFPTLKDWAESIWPIVRGTFLGFFMGIIPGGGAIVATFASYAIEKRISKHPEEFGKGVIQGVAAPEAANNAAAGGAFIPLLTLGIPSNAVMAIFLGALMLHGLEPGPLLIHDSPDVFWGLVVSMYVGNVMLMFLNLPLIGVWVKILKVPYFFLYPLIILFCIIGVYSVRNSAADVLIMFVFGVIGYLMRRFRYQAAPLILAMVLGPMLEESFRQSLITSRGSFAIFFTSPISLGFLIVALILLVIPFVTRQRRMPVDEES